MVDVAFKDLCLDAVRPSVVAAFWGELLGLQVRLSEDGDASLVGPTPRHTVWVNGVPEPQQVKNRVHLDVRVPDPTAVAGASLVRAPDEQIRWHVLADPDGLQVCAFGPREGAPYGLFELVVDSADPAAAAQWWADRFGVTLQRDPAQPWVWLEDVPGLPFPYWVFTPVPEPKTVKNRVHWDVTLADATVEDLVAAGATVLRRPDEQVRWTVLADPEGNEFCAFAPTH